MRQVSCPRCHATLALNTAFAVGNRVLSDGLSVSRPRGLTTSLLVRPFVSAGSSGQRE